ncbi:conserved hypothetical protein [Crenothrix polyspora]|uniref:Uncharacterized protein n=1 Tax=Crenothrix polyspora TaxID=360316 RepID=A0A1R4H387_9GAMM|nr:hypothetical protein [Crenothrix polyspora]SJM90715.1 conserved hypothetical protein [Crenothrix polyspora]
MSKTLKKIRSFKNRGIPNAKRTNKAPYLPNQDGKIADLAYYKAEGGDFLPDQELNGWRKAGREFSL